jgi:hypothetical protein
MSHGEGIPALPRLIDGARENSATNVHSFFGGFLKTRGILLFLALSFSALVVLSTAGCGSKVGINSGGNGGGINCGGCGANPYPVTVTMAGSSSCSKPRSIFDHMYVTVSGVQMNKSATATADSSGWFDVVPALASSPKQIDLFNFTAGNLGTGASRIGNYGSVRFFLAPNSTMLSTNSCGAAGVNCTVAGTSTAPLEVSAETSRGIVINQAAMAAGTEGIAIGSASNLSLLFDGCASLEAGRLLPKATAWSGAIQTYSLTFKDAGTGDAIDPTNVVVAMEKTDASGVDRVIAEGSPNAGILNLVGPVGPVDFVVDGQNFDTVTSTLVTFAPLAITGVTGTGTAPVAFDVNLTATSQSSGLSQTVNSGSTPIDLRIAVLQQADVAGTKTPFFTVPIFSWISSEFVSETIGCSTGFCNPASFNVPGQQLLVQSGTAGTQVLSSAPLTYNVEVNAFRQKSAGATNCTPASVTNTVNVVSPGQITAPTVQFTGCQ